ncbi:MAG: DNA-directed RNA polymerase subunit A'' [Candidatus Micrarchaeia archaeon]
MAFKKVSSQVAAFEPVGVIAAQSIGEPGTQMTMRTFHYAGVAEHVPTGLPRLIEIVDAKKVPKKPIMDIHLKSDYKTEEKAREVAYDLESVAIRDVAEVSDDLEKKKIIIRFKEKDAKELRVTFKMLKDGVEKISAFDTNVNDAEKTITIAPRGKKGLEITLHALRRLANSLRSALIKGVPGVKRAVVVKEGGETFIRSSGYNIEGVVSHPGVNPKKIYTNNIKYIESVYGIEAARNAILREIKQVLDMQKLYVDVRHIMLVSDALCAEGMVKSVGRHGLSGQKAGVLGRAAFEETIKHLVNASVRSTEDNLMGVTENIIVGQTVPMGTGKIRLMVDMPKKKHKGKEK